MQALVQKGTLSEFEIDERLGDALSRLDEVCVYVVCMPCMLCMSVCHLTSETQVPHDMHTVYLYAPM